MRLRVFSVMSTMLYRQSYPFLEGGTNIGFAAGACFDWFLVSCAPPEITGINLIKKRLILDFIYDILLKIYT